VTAGFMARYNSLWAKQTLPLICAKAKRDFADTGDARVGKMVAHCMAKSGLKKGGREERGAFI